MKHVSEWYRLYRKLHFLYLLILFSFCLSAKVFAGDIQSPPIDTGSIIKDIRREYQVINAGVPTFRKVQKELPEASSEGGALYKFYDKGKALRKMVCVSDGAIGKIREEYYLRNDTLLFVYTKEEVYKEPIDVNSNPVIREVTENRYYFNNNSMVQWLKNKQMMKPAEFPKVAKEVLQLFKGHLKE
jgi:hypothetical protein